MTNQTPDLCGLSSAEATQLQQKYGKNQLVPEKKQSFLGKALQVLAEPMFLLLIIAAVIYFILGEPRDGAIMLIFVLATISIDIIQEWKTDKTLAALKDLSAPHITALRDGKEQDIASSELVPSDIIFICEGVKIPADGIVVKCSDLCVDESSLTGESEGVWKVPAGTAEESSGHWRRDYCYAGTLATQGTGTLLVEKTAGQTEYGRIGKNVAAAPESKTPLQEQTGRLVKLCAGIAAVLFALVGVISYFNLGEIETGSRIISSILSGVTLAMAMIPEEFPVILTVFLSMGAWRLARKQSLVRRLPSVETLGAVSVLCVDKTGTITQNRMSVEAVWAHGCEENVLIETMGLACESDAYDPMEQAMIACCERHGISREHLFHGELIKEYAFTNELKMMGHVWNHDGEEIVAAKGSPERMLTICALSGGERAAVNARIEEMSRAGLRVIAVGTMKPAGGAVPARLTDCELRLLGLIGLADPPREGVKKDIARCKKAGIRLVMITGDNGITAAAIAGKIGMESGGGIITGDMLSQMSDEELRERVKSVNIFSRVIPEHKMRIVRALKENGEIVAMTGDGVNDAPALKYADIGIAMGKRGSEVSREAADLILLDDNFHTIVKTVRDGRRIYDNIKKAVGYVFTIHIPIALASLLAPLLGVAPSSLLLLPLHVMLMELIIDPTCSIVLERQPAEEDIMRRPPRARGERLIDARSLTKSVLQGLAIFAASFGSYFWVYSATGDAPLARSFGIGVIMLANLFLVQVNSSVRGYAIASLRRLARDKVMWAVLLGTLAMLGVILYTPLNTYLKLAPLSAMQLLIVLGAAAVSVLWYELVKLTLNLRERREKRRREER